MNRRQFIKAGVIGGTALAAVGAWYGYRHHGAGRIAAPVLDAGAREVIAAIAPVMLHGALPGGPAAAIALQQVVDGVEQAVAGLSASAQSEVGQLFALLSLTLTRMLVAKVGPPWPEASFEQIVAFLEDWRYSRFQLLQTGYAALHDLVLGAWYGNPASWAGIDYPGPPEVF
jgi:hypothetical protein